MLTTAGRWNTWCTDKRVPQSGVARQRLNPSQSTLCRTRRIKLHRIIGICISKTPRLCREMSRGRPNLRHGRSSALSDCKQFLHLASISPLRAFFLLCRPSHASPWAPPKWGECRTGAFWGKVVADPCSAHVPLACSQEGSTLRGWELIQQTILSHDEDMMAGFADDIDTLLVFVSDTRFS